MATDHGHPHQAMRLGQVLAARRFQYDIRVVTPTHTRGPAGTADEALLMMVADIIPDSRTRGRQGLPAWRDVMQQPVAHGGLGFTEMAAEVDLAHLSSWGATLRPMIDRFEGAGGETVHPGMRGLAAEMRRVETSHLQWAVALRRTHEMVVRQMEWSVADHAVWQRLFRMAPSRSGVEVAGGPRQARREDSGGDEEDDFAVPSILEMMQEVRYDMQHALSRALARRRLVQAWEIRTPVERARMLSGGGIGGGAFLVSRTCSLPPDLYGIAARSHLGILEPLADGLVECPECHVYMETHQIRDHVPRCPCMHRRYLPSGATPGPGGAGILFSYHRALVEEVTSIMQEAGGTTVQEMPGILVGTFERPADIAVPHLEGDG